MNQSMGLIRETVLWRLPAGTEFESSNCQLFRKNGTTTIGRRFGRQTKLHEVECLRSPHAKKPGPISGTFFTHVGAKGRSRTETANSLKYKQLQKRIVAPIH
jgi:hypothetical protein